MPIKPLLLLLLCLSATLAWGSATVTAPTVPGPAGQLAPVVPPAEAAPPPVAPEQPRVDSFTHGGVTYLSAARTGVAALFDATGGLIAGVRSEATFTVLCWSTPMTPEQVFPATSQARVSLRTVHGNLYEVHTLTDSDGDLLVAWVTYQGQLLWAVIRGQLPTP